MAYTVLARKYRSRTFDEIIGQEPIATTLVNAIKTGRIHHGYLVTGSRGVGKTSMARIMAKALNCLKAEEPTIKPCCECEACRAIGEGQDIDVIEIDAASNTGVDNIRELRSNTAYRPARSRFKIYIIDEVHMLSTGAFNALLKTLEEPPDHVKFMLATTEVQKVPATIQSRCQRFNFRNISPEAIAERLGEIAKAEGAKAEDAVLRRIARLATGSMRDALSILDQLLSVSPKKLSAEVLDEILPPAQDEQIFALLEVFCNDTIEVVRTLMLVRACGADASVVDVPATTRDAYVKLSGQFELSQYVQMIAMLEELRRNVRYSGAGRALTDALMVRFANMHEWAPIEQLLAQLGPAEAVAVEKKKPASAVASGPPAGSRRKDAAPSPARTSPSRFTPESRAPRKYERAERSAPAASGGSAAVPEAQPVATAPRRPASAEERARALADPLVQQTVDLFDGVVYVECQDPTPTDEATE